MLVLSCKVGESIIIAGGIKVTVLVSANGKAKLGFDAPKDVIIDREEVHFKRNS